MSSPDARLVPLRIRLPYGSEDEFIEKYGSNVARGGVFIATRAWKPEGTPLAFEFVLADGSRLLRGEGLVVKTQIDEGGSRSGMTVRFVRLDARSKELIDRVIAHRSGYAVANPPDTVVDAANPSPQPERQSPRPEPRSGERAGASAHPEQMTGGAGASEATAPPGLKRARTADDRGVTPARGTPLASESEDAEPEPRTESWKGPAQEHVRAERKALEQSPAPSEQAAEPWRLPADEHEQHAAAEQSQQPPAQDVTLADEEASTAALAAPPSPGEALHAPDTSNARLSAQPYEDTAVPAEAPTDVPAAVEQRAETSAGVLQLAADSALAQAGAAAAERALESARGEAPAPESRQAPAPSARRRRPSLLDVPAAQPKAAPPTALVLGIDLGTTNSRLAVFKDGKASLIPVDASGTRFALPSVIAVGADGQLLTGAEARARMLEAPDQALFGAKRLIGRRARSAKVKELSARFPFAIEPDPEGDAGVKLGDRVHPLPELYALLLARLKDAAAAHLGTEVKAAVLCVPAYFNDHQRAALRQAAKLAGLEVLRIFNEPSAVAIAFGYGRALARKRILVYDLGGGTFDATVVELTGDDLEVVATGGDNFLGGMDFDRAIAEELTRQFEEREQARVDPGVARSQRLMDSAERAKIALSDAERAHVELPAIATRTDGITLDLSQELTRESLERATAPLVERTVQLTRAVLESARVSPQHLDDVLLVGGQSRAPLVRRTIEALVQKPVRTEVDAHAAVALGAAILGHALREAQSGKRGVTLSEVLSAPIGVMVKGGAIRRVLERNTRLPAEKSIEVPVKQGEQLGLAVFQGGEPRAEDNEYLGTLNLTADKTGDLSITFSVSSDGTLELRASTPTGRKVEVEMITADASDELRSAMYEASPLPGEPEPQGKGLLGGLKRLFKRG